MSPKFVELTSRLEIQGRVGITDLSPKSADWKLKHSCNVIRISAPLNFKEALFRELSLVKKSLALLLRPSTDWTRPTNIMEVSLLYSNSTDLNVSHI